MEQDDAALETKSLEAERKAVDEIDAYADAETNAVVPSKASSVKAESLKAKSVKAESAKAKSVQAESAEVESIDGSVD